MTWIYKTDNLLFSSKIGNRKYICAKGEKLFANRIPGDSKRWSPIGSDLLDLFCLDKTGFVLFGQNISRSVALH